MIVLGGVTRLTHSGLSMVEWDPVMGVVPPLSQDQWRTVFEKYQGFPEYRKINRGMDLAGFKRIFLLEYAHRLLGRLIGALFLIPFVYFLLRRRIRRGLTPKLALIFLLGAAQGLLGWYMVKSGLVDDPRVSPLRLTAHLLLAVAIYAYLFWIALGLLPAHPTREPVRGLRPLAVLVTAGIVLTIAAGGLVAGTRAGFVFNTFPLMAGALWPPGLYELSPWWRNLVEPLLTVQFNHRALALVTLLLVVACWWQGRRIAGRLRRAAHTLVGMGVAQVALGIATLLWVIPVPLAAAHQGGALLLLSAALWVCRELWPMGGRGARPGSPIRQRRPSRV